MFRKCFILTLTVFMLSLFFISNVFAHMTGESGAGNDWDVEVKELDNKWRDVDRSVNEYHAMRGHVETLISGWESTKNAVAEGTTVTILTGGAAIISAGVTYLSGGSFAPAAWLFYIAARKGLATYSLDSDKYLEVMGAALGAMDTGRSNIGAAYNGGTMYVKVGGIETKQKTIGYAEQYKNYLQMCENHGIEHYVEGQDWTWTAASKEAIDALVNLQNQTRHWYHAIETPSHDEHSITRRTDLSHWQVQPDLPTKYKCEGRCSVKFRSPHEAFTAHRKTCADFNTSTFSRRCTRPAWYTCDTDHTVKAELHKVRTCAKTYTDANGNRGRCLDANGNPQQYKDCLYNLPWLSFRDHNESDDSPLRSPHSDKANSDTDETAQNPSTPSTPVDNSPNCDSCTTGGCSACPVVGGCGHTYSPSEASSHAFQASCLETNEWGQTCTVAAFYACQTHTHQYPALVKCGRGPCQDQVPWTTFHQKICTEGHTYWSCNQASVERHKSRGPCKRLIQRQVFNYQTWRNELVWQECGVDWTNCRPGMRKCYDVNNQYRGDHIETAPPAPQPTPQ